MHVHVDEFGRQVEEQHEGRMPVVVHDVAVRLADRVGEQPVADEAAVHEDVLRVARAAGGGGQTGEAAQREWSGGFLEAHRGAREVRPEDRGDALFRRLRRQPPVGLAVVREPECDVGPGERDAQEPVLGMGVFGGGRAQELPAGGRVVVEIEDVDDGAAVALHRLGIGQRAAVRLDLPAVPRVGRATRERDVGDRRDAREGLPAEAQRADAFEVLEAGDLAGGVAGEREDELVAVDAAAVVLHADAPDATVVERDLDIGRAGVEAVLEEFLEGGGRALDDLAGGDLVDEQVGEDVDVWHGRGRIIGVGYIHVQFAHIDRALRPL